MVKGFQIFTIFILSLAINFSAFAQLSPEDASGKYSSRSVVRRLSYQNFKNIRKLTTAIKNFEGAVTEKKGLTTFEKLVNQYSQASSLYFSNEFDKSAQEFLDNEKKIKKTAMKIAEVYRSRTIKLHKDLITYNTQINVKETLEGKTIYQPSQKLLLQASHSVLKANDYYERYLPVKAIYSFRRAKSDVFYYYEIKRDRINNEIRKLDELLQFKKNKIEEVTAEEKKEQLDEYKGLKAGYNADIQKITKKRKKLLNAKDFIEKRLEEYKRDIIDNRNKIYLAKEKQN